MTRKLPSACTLTQGRAAGCIVLQQPPLDYFAFRTVQSALPVQPPLLLQVEMHTPFTLAQHEPLPIIDMPGLALTC